MKHAYINTPETQRLLEQNQLADFEQLWTLEAEWFEAPNYRRNGWSGVSKYALTDAHGKTIWVFIKRQENHNFKTILHPLKGMPTFRREYDNIRHLNNKNIPTLTTLFYGERSINGKEQAILITQSLEGYQSFEDFFSQQENQQLPQHPAIMALTGKVIRAMHDAHFRHNCLYSKHLFVKCNGNDIDVRLIDLEKLKWLPLTSHIRRNDLSRLIRRCDPLTYEDLKNILSSYYQSGKDLQKTALAKELDTLLNNQERF